MATSMLDILSDAPEEKPDAPAAEPETTEPAAPAAEAADAPERAQSRRKEHQRKEWAAQGRDPETGQFTSKKEEAPAEEKAPEAAAAPAPEVKTEAKPAEEMTPKEKAAFAAAADERRKRQALEQELARLRQPPPATAAPAGQPAQPKGFWDDPEGALKTEEQKRHQHAIQTKLQVSELIARNKYTDFDEKIAKFAELVQQTPGLGQQWIVAQDPGEFAYTAAKNHMLLEQAGNLDNLRSEIEAKARADERAKVEAEFKKREEDAKQKRAALTPSLSDVQGAGRKPQAQWTGPTPMSDILK